MRNLLLVLLCLSLFASAQKAQKKETKKPEPAKPAASTPEDDSDLKGLTWRQVGPFRGGRSLAVSGVVGDPLTYYFGGVGGGVWKTTDAGSNWTPLTDKEKFSSVGAIAVAPSDANTIYVGTGEGCWRGNIIAGDGVYKSTDAGKTWQNMGLKDTLHIARILVDPKDANKVFVAALGHAYGPNTERGLFRSVDGGKTWDKVLYKDENTGAVDISIDPNNSSIIFAALYQAKRLPWDSISGGPGSGLYRSADGGATWKKVEDKNLPPYPWGKVGVSVSADSNRIYAQIEAANKGGLYRSDDGGTKWQLINDDRRFQQRAWYYTHIFADPKSPDTLYSLNVQMSKSTDAGKTWKQISAPHGDTHGLWIDPTAPQRMIEANDGGATVTLNGGQTWSSLDNQPTAQFYHVITDQQVPYRIYGAQQDNSTVSIPSRARGSIDRTDWYTVGGCESGYIAPAPDGSIVYSGCYGGHITRYDRKLDDGQEVTAWPLNPLGAGAADLKYRWQWTAPIVLSPHDPNVLYHTANKVLKSTNGGMSWQEISPDLTRNDKSKQQSAGGPITKDNTSVEYYDTIFAFAESPAQKDVLWAGSDDGLIHISRDGSKSWQNVTPKNLPEWSLISLIDPSKSEAGTAYIAVDRHQLDDFSPIILKTTDFGATWSRVEGDLPKDATVRAVRMDPVRKGLLFAATEKGVYYSTNDGGHWRSLQRNLPMSSMRDLVIHDNDLIVATHGRGFWVLDDISPLRQMSGDATASRVVIPSAQREESAPTHDSQLTTQDSFRLFQPSNPYRILGGGGRPQPNVGTNPPAGAIIYYSLKTSLEPAKKEEKKEGAAEAAAKSTPEQEPKPSTAGEETKSETAAKPAPAQPRLKLEILDASGKVIRTYPDPNAPAPEGEGATREALPAEAGLNRFAWDMRYANATNVPGAILWGGGTQGPVALSGKYEARLTLDSKSQTQSFEVKPLPDSKITVADLQKQFDLLAKIQAKVGAAHETVNQIRDARAQLNAFTKRLADAKDPREKEFKDAAKKIDAQMTAIEEALIQTKSKSGQDPLNYGLKLNNQMAALGGEIDGFDAAPTEQSYAVYEFLAPQIDAQVEKWKQLVAGDLKAFNDSAKQKDVPVILLKK
jgi:photosystem II stability/assembly factor-like uncharacterized protein